MENNTNKLKLITGDIENIKFLDYTEINNLNNYVRMEKYFRNLCKFLNQSSKTKPRLEMSINRPISMIEIKYKKTNQIIIDGYVLTEMTLSQNKKKIYIKVVDIKTDETFYTNDKLIAKYLKKRNLLNREELNVICENVAKKYNLDFENVWYDEKYKNYVIELFDFQIYSTIYMNFKDPKSIILSKKLV